MNERLLTRKQLEAIEHEITSETRLSWTHELALEVSKAQDAKTAAALEAKYAPLVEAAKVFVEINVDSCQYDHHGYCQTHSLNNPCEVAMLREALCLLEEP